MSTDLQLSLDNLTQWAAHLQMRVEALETKTYGSSVDLSKIEPILNNVKSTKEAALKPDCPGYTECKEMLLNLQRENNELKKLNQLIILDLDKELQESDAIISLRQEQSKLIEEKKLLQADNDYLNGLVKKLTDKLDNIFNILTNTVEHKE